MRTDDKICEDEGRDGQSGAEEEEGGGGGTLKN